MGGAGAERHDDIDSLVRAVGGALHAEVRLLVKGSRVNKLERVVAALTGAGPARRAV